MYYSVNVCDQYGCTEKCVSDLSIFFQNKINIYIVFDNAMIDFVTDPDKIMKVNVPRSDGSISSWYCYGCKNDLSSFLVYENLSSSSLSKSVRYDKFRELNSDDVISRLRNMKVDVLEKLYMNILKYNENLYKKYIKIHESKNDHINKMKNILKEIEYLPFIGIKYIYDFENIYKPNHNTKMKQICMEISILPPFEHFQGGIEYLESLRYFNENK